MLGVVPSMRASASVLGTCSSAVAGAGAAGRPRRHALLLVTHRHKSGLRCPLPAPAPPAAFTCHTHSSRTHHLHAPPSTLQLRSSPTYLPNASSLQQDAPVLTSSQHHPILCVHPCAWCTSLACALAGAAGQPPLASSTALGSATSSPVPGADCCEPPTAWITLTPAPLHQHPKPPVASWLYHSAEPSPIASQATC
jgi:hypothetical protein